MSRGGVLAQRAPVGAVAGLSLLFVLGCGAEPQPAAPSAPPLDPPLADQEPTRDTTRDTTPPAPEARAEARQDVQVGAPAQAPAGVGDGGQAQPVEGGVLLGQKGEALGGAGLAGYGVGGGSGAGVGGLGTGVISGRGGGRGSSGVGYGSGTAFTKAKADAYIRGPSVPDREPGAAVGAEINGEVLTAQDRFSTFAADVDTASYSLTRRALGEGQRPSAGSVRVEEFINAFDYRYPTPTLGQGAPLSVYLEGAPSPFTPDRHVLRVAVVGAEPAGGDRAPVHLTFLVDTSGSMNGPDRMGLLQQSLLILVDNLQAQDTVAIATYAGSTQVLLRPTPATQRDTLRAAIEGLRTGGGTNMGSGMELAYSLASEGYVYGHENRVIVLSDGDANIGRTSADAMLTTVRQHAEEGITLSTIGFGMGNYKDSLMEQLADKGDGNYAYIDDLREARRVFSARAAGTLVTIARDVKLQVEFNPGAVRAWRLIGYENRDVADADFRVDEVDAGEVGAGHTVTALYEVDLLDGFAERELATVRVRARPPGPDRPAQEWSTTLIGAQVHPELALASRATRLALSAAGLAELLRGSPYTGALTWAGLTRLAETTLNPAIAEEAELLRLIGLAARG